MTVIQIVNQMILMSLLKTAKMMKTQNISVKMKKNLEKMKNIKVQTGLKKEWKTNKKSSHKIK